ncbi:MAG: DUF4129 domain-containing transglutaminase family protein, partial [Sandaracinaceae bacterium]
GDAGAADGGSADGGGRDGGPADGGRGRGDGGLGDGGAGGAGDGGAPSDPWPGWDAGLDDLELPPSERGEPGQGRRSSGGPMDQQDLFEQPPATGDQGAAPVAVVLFEADYAPPSEAYYFRQGAWSRFEGTRLVPAERPGADRDVATRFPAGRLEVDAPPAWGRTEVSTLVALLVAHPEPFALEAPVRFDDTRNPNPRRFVRAYRALSLAQSAPYRSLLGRTAGDPGWSDELRRLYLTPHPDPRFTAFAVETVERLPLAQRADPFRRAVAIKLRLDEMLIYSSAETHRDAPDAAVDFFFGNRTGYCVHFAHTAVYLFRAAGIPARVGVGYMAPEARRRGGSSLLVQAGDAHSWPEIYLDPIGWIVLDVQPARNLDPPRPATDPELQRQLGDLARELPPDPEEELEPAPPARLPPAGDVARGLVGAFALVLLALLMSLYAVKAWRRLRPAFSPPRALPRVAYRAALDRLAEAGWVREPGETRQTFAARVATASPAFQRATELHLRARLGVPDGADEVYDRAAWRGVGRAVARELAGAVPWWRRALGALHPLAFLDAR